MFSWIRRYQTPIFGLLLLVFILQLIAWDLKEGRFWNMPARILITVSAVPLRVVRGAVEGVRDIGEWFQSKKELMRENGALREEVLYLRARSRELAEIDRENARLRNLLDTRERRPLRTILAHVVGGEPLNNFGTILLDKGAKDGIRPGQAVITAEGLVGQILRAAPSTAQVLLLADPNSSVDVMMERSRAKGIVTGWRGEVCQVKFVGRREDVAVGDIIITSGLGGDIPKGLAVGTVKEIEKKSWGVFQSVYLAPAVDFGKLEEVLVVRE